MTTRIAWTCMFCLRRVDGLDVAVVPLVDDQHECRSADLIRRAAAHYLDSGRPEDQKVSEWLDSCANDADGMEHLEDFDVCDQPDSVRRALDVALTLTGGARGRCR